MSEHQPTSHKKLSALSNALDDHDRRKQQSLARSGPALRTAPVVGPKTGMSRVALVLGLCFVWACNLGVMALQIAAMTGAIRFEGALPTWGEVIEQVVLGLLLSAALVTFYKFRNRTPPAPGA